MARPNVFAKVVFVGLAILLFGSDGSARAGFVRVNGKDTHWVTPVTIMVFTDGLMGADLDNFEMGINSWFGLVGDVTVQFKPGNPPPNTPNAVSITLVAPNTLRNPAGMRVFSETTTAVNETANDALITGADISIDRDALGMDIFMKNLGAHEFGHVFGLDENPRTSGNRVNVMDPDFTKNDPFLSPSLMDYDMLKTHYLITPEPSSVVSAGLGLFIVCGYFFRKGKKADLLPEK